MSEGTEHLDGDLDGDASKASYGYRSLSSFAQQSESLVDNAWVEETVIPIYDDLNGLARGESEKVLKIEVRMGSWLHAWCSELKHRRG